MPEHAILIFVFSVKRYMNSTLLFVSLVMTCSYIVFCTNGKIEIVHSLD